MSVPKAHSLMNLIGLLILCYTKQNIKGVDKLQQKGGKSALVLTIGKKCRGVVQVTRAMSSTQ